MMISIKAMFISIAAYVQWCTSSSWHKWHFGSPSGPGWQTSLTGNSIRLVLVCIQIFLPSLQRKPPLSFYSSKSKKRLENWEFFLLVPIVVCLSSKCIIHRKLTGRPVFNLYNQLIPLTYILQCTATKFCKMYTTHWAFWLIYPISVTQSRSQSNN